MNTCFSDAVYKTGNAGAIGGGTMATVFLASMVTLCIVVTVVLFRRSAGANNGTCTYNQSINQSFNVTCKIQPAHASSPVYI